MGNEASSEADPVSATGRKVSGQRVATGSESSRKPWSLRSLVRSAVGPVGPVGPAVGKLRDEIRIMNTHRKSVRKARRLCASGLRLNCGCGPNVKEGWINIDLFSPRADLQLDLR